MATEDTRWKQRYANYQRSVANLTEALKTEDPSKLEQQGIVKAFELTYELAWKTLQDYVQELGISDTVGPKAVIRRAFREGLIDNGDGWKAMHVARNQAAHLYDGDRAGEIVAQIRATFFPLLTDLHHTLEGADDDTSN